MFSRLRNRISAFTFFACVVASAAFADPVPLAIPADESFDLKAGQSYVWEAPNVAAGSVFEWSASVKAWDLGEADRVTVTYEAAGQRAVSKTLNEGDPSLHSFVRSGAGGAVRVRAKSESTRQLPVNFTLRALPAGGDDLLAFEAEPNNSWREAGPMKIGRSVYGNNDDADYLDNAAERPVKNFANGLDNAVRDRVGLDWFRLDFDKDEPTLVIFELDVLDRDVSVNLRMYKPNADGSDVDLFLDGHDPMEIIHDREPERYSKSITRTLTRGTYYLQVNGNHPRYILRSKAYAPPPYTDAAEAVRVGAHYIMNVGDAWVAQVPRDGNIYNRVENLHDSTLRCTACHPSIFSTEAVLTARKAGYEIEAKSNFRYVVDRIYNGPSPLYGPLDVNWQRYIAIPLQSQGKHGGILMDFEKMISGRETPIFMRYAPFLRKAWTGQEKLHDDEQNGVVPLDSNVGIAVRDWRVMGEAYRRTGDRGYLETADHLRDLVTGPKCDQKNIQDRIHRIWGFAIMEKTPGEFRTELTRAIDEMMGYQNADGGWPDVLEPGRGSAVYTTGQVIWTLTQAGETLRGRPALQKGIDYLLSQQQAFGGWFQTTTHENFRTPMRETRYAVMALAATHPQQALPMGWGNRGGGVAAPPRTGSVLHTLDDLDALWQVPQGREDEFTAAIVPLLDSPEPLVRSVALETLGRVGTGAALEPALKALGDPVKDVMRSAAWTVRQFGNRGEGQEPLKGALASADPAVRRGACRAFANHYFGMDERLDIAEEIMKQTADANMWTRLEAFKTLRQWFYRSGENSFKRRVVDLYIAAMARPEPAVIRTNLEQGMYIMLDENEAGGVSIERNIAEFPLQRDRDAVIAARTHVEQAVLLEPVLEGLATGNALQREALLASFDGSFFRGRFYAQNPRNMIDVGNDREFGFYYQPPQALLARVFKALFSAGLPAAQEDQALRLASFFFVPKETTDPELQMMLLGRLEHADPAVRETALGILRNEMEARGAVEGSGVTARLVKSVEGGEAPVRLAAIEAVKRNDALLHSAPMKALAAEWIAKGREDRDARAMLLALAETDLLTGDQAAESLEAAWAETEDDNLRLTLTDRLFNRAAMTDQMNPPQQLVRLLRAIAVDPVTGVREKFIERLEKTKELRKSPRIIPALLAGVSDASPGIRLRSMKIAQDQPDFWRQGETTEYALRLLIDPDPKIRALALETVEKFGLLAAEPRFARRVKALEGDRKLKEKALALLNANKLDPAVLDADGSVQNFGIPDLDFFREKVNPYFYVEGADKQSCANCHQNHSILRLASPPDEGVALPDALVIENMNSALKVVNLGDPEQSLILRKPRSPAGQGVAPADSPTGLVHVGGTRWPTAADPGYQAMLTWIRDAANSSKRRLGAVASTDSYSPEYPPAQALDGDPETIWHTEFVGASPGYPHEIAIDLGESAELSALQYVPRQESGNGRVKGWEVYLSADGIAWGAPVASGEWADDGAVKTVGLKGATARHVKLRGLGSVNGQPFMSAAEVIVLRSSRQSGAVAAAPK